MIKRKEQMPVEVCENRRGGIGKIPFTHVFAEGEVANCSKFSLVTMEPGTSIGVHPHNGNGEVYLVLDGAVTIPEDGVEYILNAGDAEYCGDGHTHGIRNHTDAPATILMAIITK